ncbi:MAG: MBL fold metallo-hydrolase, partial [Candidatus Vogelbacteria bacterium]|nr:MBL fold metallo-hydrolase [Candidatus Vogelbacteria bacterium]
MNPVKRIRVDSNGNVETFIGQKKPEAGTVNSFARTNNPNRSSAPSRPFNRPNRAPYHQNRPHQAKPAGTIATPSTSMAQTTAPKTKFMGNRKGPRPHYQTKIATDHGSDNEDSDKPKVKERIPELATGNIRIIPLGGVEEIGKNMTVIEIGNDIIVVDAGFLFPGEDAPGVDYIIPDTEYLESRKHKIRGLLVTHGHLDHIGGIPYLMAKIGNPPISTS